MDHLTAHVPSLRPQPEQRRPDPALCSRPVAAELAGRLLTCFKASAGSDVGMTIANYVTIFTHYPEEIVRMVCDPFDGLPSKLQWEPSIREVRQACDERMTARREIAELRQRFRPDRALPAPSRPTWEQIQAGLAARGLPTPEELAGKPNPEEVRKQAEIDLRRLASAPREPLTVGPELARKITAAADEMRATQAFRERREELEAERAGEPVHGRAGR